MCMGERLAKAELFLFTVNCFQMFKFRFDPESPEPSLDASPASFLARWPSSYKLVVDARRY